MSPAPGPERDRAKRSRGVRRYIRYALGEILLIFLGITLAMSFSNRNEGRHLRKQELEALADIVTNLKANDEQFRRKISEDATHVAACERFVTALGRREPWSDGLGRDRRSSIVNLYEQVYAYLVNDRDKVFWAFHAAVMEPGFNHDVHPAARTG